MAVIISRTVTLYTLRELSTKEMFVLYKALNFVDLNKDETAIAQELSDRIGDHVNPTHKEG